MPEDSLRQRHSATRQKLGWACGKVLNGKPCLMRRRCGGKQLVRKRKNSYHVIAGITFFSQQFGLIAQMDRAAVS
jgi:hypothetical protein